MSTTEPVIRAEEICKRFGARWALENVGFTLRPGEFFSLFGPNGAGKTTLLRVLSTLLRPNSGKLRLFGCDPRRNDEVRVRLGFLTHRTFLYPHLTGAENLAFYGRLYGLDDLGARIDRRAREVGIADRLGDLVGNYSSGMQRRLALARTLLHDPALVILDEPFAGVDPGGMEELESMLGKLRETGQTVVMATHHLEEGFRLGDRVMVLVSGRAVFTGETARMDPDDFRRQYALHTQNPPLPAAVQ